MMEKNIFITGASSGIGLELTRSLAANGFMVIAAARNADGLNVLKKLENKNVFPIILDVTDHKEIEKQFKAVDFILADTGLYGLINNAGIAVPGPIELITPEEFDKELQVNVVGVLAVTQSALHYLSKNQSKIINIGSISGRITVPFLGAYSASKFALKALTEAMRLELKLLGVSVTYIEAGNIKTPIWQKGTEAVHKMILRASPSQTHYVKQMKAFIEVSQKKANSASSPDVVIQTILACLEKKKLKASYLVGKDAKLLAMINKIISTEKINSFINRLMNRA